jgi:hypothetical protein
MTFKDQMALDFDAMNSSDQFGETITYNGVTITVQFDETHYMHEKLFNGRAAIVCVKKADVPSPSYRDVIVRGGVTWHVYSDDMRNVQIEGDGLIDHWILVYRGERLERAD